MRSKTQHRYDDTSPQHWIKKHNEQKNKRKQPIFPDVGSYNPRTIEYKLFGNKEQHKSNKNLMGKIDRFKTEPKGSSLGPGQYNVLVEWPGKGKNKN